MKPVTEIAVKFCLFVFQRKSVRINVTRANVDWIFKFDDILFFLYDAVPFSLQDLSNSNMFYKHDLKAQESNCAAAWACLWLFRDYRPNFMIYEGLTCFISDMSKAVEGRPLIVGPAITVINDGEQ